MGTLSTKGAQALDKVLKRRTLAKLNQFLQTLEVALDNYETETLKVEHEAERILTLEYTQAGQEIIDKGTLEHNLTRNLDGASLTRAISTTTSVYNMLKAKREAWVVQEKAKWEAGTQTKAIKFVEDATRGPGVYIPAPPFKT